MVKVRWNCPPRFWERKFKPFDTPH
jgi:hypothetical protein